MLPIARGPVLFRLTLLVRLFAALVRVILLSAAIKLTLPVEAIAPLWVISPVLFAVTVKLPVPAADVRMLSEPFAVNPIVPLRLLRLTLLTGLLNVNVIAPSVVVTFNVGAVMVPAPV